MLEKCAAYSAQLIRKESSMLDHSIAFVIYVKIIVNNHFQSVLSSGALQIEMETVKTSASSSFIFMSTIYEKSLYNAINMVDKPSDFHSMKQLTVESR